MGIKREKEKEIGLHFEKWNFNCSKQFLFQNALQRVEKKKNSRRSSPISLEK
jgi:hypothetical protein